MKKIFKEMKTWTSKLLFLLAFIFPLIPKTLHDIGGFIPIRLFLVTLFILVFFIEVIKKKIKIKNTKFIKIFCIIYALFLLTIGLSLFRTSNIIISLYTMCKYGSYGLLIFAFLNLNLSSKEKKFIVFAFLTASAILLITGLLQYIFNFGLNINGAYKYDVKGRIYTTFYNPCYYAFFCNVLFVLLMELKRKAENKKVNIVLSFLLILTVTNLILTFTRSAYLIFVGSVGLYVILSLFNKTFKEIWKPVGFCFVTFLCFCLFLKGEFLTMYSSVYQFSPAIAENILASDFIKKLTGMDDDYNQNPTYLEDDASMGDRELFKKYATDVGKNNYYIGVGVGAYEYYLTKPENLKKYEVIDVDRFYPHHTYLQLFAETGMTGLVGFFIIIIFFSATILIFTLKKSLNIAILIIWVSALLIGFYESIFYDAQITPILIAIIMLLSSQNIKKIKNL